MITIYSHGNITYGNSILSLPSTSCDLVTTTDSLPIGCVTAYAGHNTPPTGWLFCDGSEKNKTDASYSALFNIIGYTYGGSGNTFNLPKMISDASYGIFPAGSATTSNKGFYVDNSLNITNININQKIGANQIPLHNHTFPNHNHTFPNHNHTSSNHNHTSPAHNHTSSNHNHTIESVTAIKSFTNNISNRNAENSGTNDVITSFTGNASSTLDASKTSGESPSTTSTESPSTTSTESPSTTSTESSNTTSSGSSATITEKLLYTQTDYVPNYTAFLWVIKCN